MPRTRGQSIRRPARADFAAAVHWPQVSQTTTLRGWRISNEDHKPAQLRAGLIRRHGADLRFGELKSLGHKVILALSQAG